MPISNGKLIVAILYATLTLGIIIKLHLRGCRGATLMMSPFIPFLIFGIPIAYGIKSVRRGDRKLSYAFGLMRISIKYLPILIVVMGESIDFLVNKYRNKKIKFRLIGSYYRKIFLDEALGFSRKIVSEIQVLKAT